MNFAYKIRDNNYEIFLLHTPCISSKSIQVVKQNKNMILTINKLEEVHINLWDLHNLPSQSENYCNCYMQVYTEDVNLLPT